MCIILPEIKRRIALGWASFSMVANIMKSRKASLNEKRNVHNEYVLPVMVYGSETWALKKAHKELLSVAQRKIERSCSASPYATTNVIPGYDIRQV